MKTWKIIAGNVLSGCVGAALVMGTAQAQKATPEDALREVRTHKLVIVDENNKERSRLEPYSSGAHLIVGSGKSHIMLTASDASGCEIGLDKADRRYCTISVNDIDSSIRLSSGNYSSDLSAGNASSELKMIKIPDDNKNKLAPPPAGPLNLHMITASVDNDGTYINAYGKRSAMTVGAATTLDFAAMQYNYDEPDSGSIKAEGPNKFQWSQPPAFGSRQR